MAEFTVKSQALQGSEDNMDRMARQLSSIQERINSVRNSLSFQVGASSYIRARLRSVANEVNTEQRGMRGLAAGLEQSRRKYAGTENRICGRAKSGNAIQGVISAVLYGTSLSQLLPRRMPWELADYRPGKVFPWLPNLELPELMEYVNRILSDRMNSLFELQDFLGKFVDNRFHTGMPVGDIKDKIDWKDFLLVGITSYDAINAFIKEMEDFKGEFLDGIVDATTIKGAANASWKYWDASVEGQYGSAGVTALAADAYASGEAGLITKTEDGNLLFNPHIDAQMGVSFTALQAEAEAHVGDEMLGAYANGNVTVGEVNANAKASVGIFDENGEIDPRLKVSAGAEAIAVEAKAEAGVTVLGTEAKVEAGVNVGIGAHADVGYEDGVLSFDVGASFGIGASIAIEIDIGGTIDAIKEKAKSGILSWLMS